MARTSNKLDISNKPIEQEFGETNPNPIKRKPGRPRKSPANGTGSNPETGTGTGTGTGTKAAKNGTGNTRLDSADFQLEEAFVEPNQDAFSGPEPLSFIDNIAEMEPAKKRGRVSKDAKAYEAASELVTIANILAVTVAGPQAGMNGFEEPIITASLARTLVKNNNAAKVEEKMTPVTLAIGLTVWALRIGKITYDNNKQKVENIASFMREKRVKEPAKPSAPTSVIRATAPDKVEPNNGYVGEGTFIKSMLENDANI